MWSGWVGGGMNELRLFATSYTGTNWHATGWHATGWQRHNNTPAKFPVASIWVEAAAPSVLALASLHVPTVCVYVCACVCVCVMKPCVNRREKIRASRGGNDPGRGETELQVLRRAKSKVGQSARVCIAAMTHNWLILHTEKLPTEVIQ